MSHSTSIVPIVLWGKTPPSHSISVITCTYDQRTVVTGTYEGQIGLWDLRHTKEAGLKLVPRNLIFAHGSQVVDIACAPDASYDRPNIVSLAENGELCLWDIEDGLCLQMQHLPGQHKKLHSVQITKGSMREWRLLLYGLYSDIHVLDTLTLEVLYTLKSYHLPDWITALCTLRPARKQEETLIALTVSNCLKVWILKAGYEKKRADAVFEQESKSVECFRAKGMCCNPFTQRTILVVSARVWQIFDASDYSFLAAMPSPYKQALMGGDFVAANRVLVWDKGYEQCKIWDPSVEVAPDVKRIDDSAKEGDRKPRLFKYPTNCKVAGIQLVHPHGAGKAHLYRLPSKYLLGAEGAEQHATDKSSRTPILICQFETDGTKGNFGAPMYFSYGRRGPFYKLLFQGTSKGSICVWKVPDSEQADQALSKGVVSDTDVAASATVVDEGVKTTVHADERLLLKAVMNKMFTFQLMLLGKNFNLVHKKGLENVIPYTVKMSLNELWKVTNPIGLIDGLEEEEDHVVPVTASLYLPSQGRIVCGRKNGSIVVINAARAALAQLLQPNNITKTGWPPFNILSGHTEKVTCLLYPHDENPRYDISHLVSGGADFTVRLWDIFNETLLHTFHCHGGEVTKLMVTPPDCSGRFLSAVCSVAQDHSVALIGLREMKTVLLASRHTFPVETIRWRGKDDFMVVGCSDGTVYVWQMETGHLDRCVAGSVAYDILESCYEDASSPSAAVREYHRKFRRLTSMTQQLPFELTTPAVVKRVKKKISTIQQQVIGEPKQASSPSQSDSKPVVSSPPTRVCSLRCYSRDSDIHVILLDPEALIRQLLTEEAQAAAGSGQPVNPKRHQLRGLGQVGSPLVANKSGGNTSTLNKLSGTVSHEIAQLLLSCIHAWGVDPHLDDTCINKLGMLKPVQPISFGLLTRGRLSLMFPGWYVCGQEDNIAGALEAGLPPEQVDAGDDDDRPFDTKIIHYNAHWQLSSSLTTQHLISIVSVTNTLMSMNHVSFIVGRNQNADGNFDEYSPVAQITGEAKAGWSLLATLHCCLLPEMMRGLKYRPPLLHILARRWQDRCLEIREAAQAILLAELRRIGSKGRKQLIDAWSPHLPQDIESADFGFEDLEQYVNVEEDKPIVVTAEEDRSDIAMVMMTTRKMVSSDIRLRHATAIVMLGVIGAEFQKEVDPLLVSKDSKGESLMDINTLRNTAKALTSLLLQRPSAKTPAYSAIRRAAIDLIGRGFALWEPHIDVSQVLIGLLELSANSELKARQADSERGLILSAAVDLHRSSRHALSLVATSRSAAFITTLAKEVARHVATTSSMSFNQPSPAAIAVYSHVRHQPSSAADAQSSSIIQFSKHEILRIIELMIEKSQMDVVDLIVESVLANLKDGVRRHCMKFSSYDVAFCTILGKVVDIVVHCLDHKALKERGLTEVFPALCKFNMVSYCSQTRRLAVGARLGHIALYELRSSRCQLIPAHNAPITALAFSPEGKVLSSYSHEDGKISFWQTSTSLLGMLSSTIKCISTYNTVSVKGGGPTAQVQKQIRLVWVSHKTVVLLTGDGAQHTYSV